MSYFSHADPRLGDVDEEAVLGPFPGALGFFEGKICAVLLEVDLHDECDAGMMSDLSALGAMSSCVDVRIQAALVLAQQRQCLLCLARLLQHNAHQQLYT